MRDASAKGFEYLDHTADIGIVAWGPTLKAAYAQAALGMFSFIADLDGVAERESREVKVSSADREGLLVDWLNELLYIFDVEHLLLVRFEVDKLGEASLEARCYGEKVDLGRHHIKAGVKAATYHMVSVEEREGGRVRVILDI